MDTDDLSRETYEAVIIEAEKLSHDLTLHFGVLSYDCKNEKEYLEKSKQLVYKIKQLNAFELEDLLFGNVPDKIKLDYTLDKIIHNIKEVEKIPVDKREYEF